MRVAELVINAASLDAYQAALKLNAETAMRVEPGVLTMYAVSEKKHPTHILIFEIYADTAAYKAHLQTSHFLKYKNTVKDMVRSLSLVDVYPIALESKVK